MKFKIPTETLWISVGITLAFNLYGFVEDVKYLFKGRERYFEEYMKNFIHPSKTMLTHAIVICLCLAVYFLSLYTKWSEK